MPQDKTIKGVMERFDEKFSYGDDEGVYDCIKQFIQQEIKLALESVVPEEKSDWIDLGEIQNARDDGYNQAIDEIKENIKHYLE